LRYVDETRPLQFTPADHPHDGDLHVVVMPMRVFDHVIPQRQKVEVDVKEEEPRHESQDHSKYPA